VAGSGDAYKTIKPSYELVIAPAYTIKKNKKGFYRPIYGPYTCSGPSNKKEGPIY